MRTVPVRARSTPTVPGGSPPPGTVRISPVRRRHGHRTPEPWPPLDVGRPRRSPQGVGYGQIEKDLDDLGRRGREAFTTLAPGIGAGHVNEITVMLKRSAD